MIFFVLIEDNFRQKKNKICNVKFVMKTKMLRINVRNVELNSKYDEMII